MVKVFRLVPVWLLMVLRLLVRLILPGLIIIACNAFLAHRIRQNIQENQPISIPEEETIQVEQRSVTPNAAREKYLEGVNETRQKIDQVRSDVDAVCQRIGEIKAGVYEPVLVAHCRFILEESFGAVAQALDSLEAEVAMNYFWVHAKFEAEKRALRDEINRLRRYLETRPGSKDVRATSSSQLMRASANLKQVHSMKYFEATRADTAKKLLKTVAVSAASLVNPCSRDKPILWCKICCCGWGCRVSHALWCWFSALATSQQVLFVDPTAARMTADDVLVPINGVHLSQDNNTCTLNNSKFVPQDVPRWPNKSLSDLWPGHSVLNTLAKRTSEKELKSLGISQKMPPFLPKKLYDKMMLLTDDPVAWYVGVFTRQLVTPTRHFSGVVQKRVKQLDIGETVTAGIHVRRTDKSSECSPQQTAKYMSVVEDFFKEQDFLQDKSLKRRVFVVSDDLENVIQDIKSFYPTYTVLTWLPDSENRTETLEDLVASVLILAKVDFAAVTYSSNVGRVVYQLRMAEGPDAGDTTVSLDTDWFLVLPNVQPAFTAVQSHHVDGELDIEAGDRVLGVSVSGGHQWAWLNASGRAHDGLTAGINYHRHAEGFFPRFKTKIDRKYQIESLY